MKIGQFKVLLGWILVITVINLGLLVFALSSIAKTQSQITNLNGGTYDKAQLTSLQSSVNQLSSNVESLKSSSSSSRVGSSSASAGFTYLSCSGTVTGLNDTVVSLTTHSSCYPY